MSKNTKSSYLTMFKLNFQTKYHTGNISYHTFLYRTVSFNSLCQAISPMLSNNYDRKKVLQFKLGAPA
jgi:hypothetical protein